MALKALGRQLGAASIGPLDVRDYLEVAKWNGLSTDTLKQHMAAMFDHRRFFLFFCILSNPLSIFLLL